MNIKKKYSVKTIETSTRCKKWKSNTVWTHIEGTSIIFNNSGGHYESRFYHLGKADPTAIQELNQLELE